MEGDADFSSRQNRSGYSAYDTTYESRSTQPSPAVVRRKSVGMASTSLFGILSLAFACVAATPILELLTCSQVKTVFKRALSSRIPHHVEMLGFYLRVLNLRVLKLCIDHPHSPTKRSSLMTACGKRSPSAAAYFQSLGDLATSIAAVSYTHLTLPTIYAV